MMRTWVTVSRSAFDHNIKCIARWIEPACLALVLKSNAYGHGLHLIGQWADAHEAVSMLCVVHHEEAFALKEAGIKKRIIVLSPYPFENTKLSTGCEYTIYSRDELIALDAQSKRLHEEYLIHLKIDSGMSRLGCVKEEISSILELLKEAPRLKLTGVLTHVCDKDNPIQSFTQSQLSYFQECITLLIEGGYDELDVHALSSDICSTEASMANLARVGTHAYGFWGSHTSKKRTLAHDPESDLKLIGTWKTRIMQIKRIEVGAYVGYGRTFQAQRPTTIAVLPIGYWDGYPRALSNKGYVLVHGQPAPVIGIVSMNLMTIDITDIISQIPVAVHDEVIIVGDHPLVHPDKIGQLINTINIEITTRINPLIPRISTT
jgi:alanine racemase